MDFLQKGLGRRILVLTLSIAVGASMTIGVISLLMFYQYSKNQVLERNRETAVHISDMTAAVFSHGMSVISAMAEDPEIREVDTPRAREGLKRMQGLEAMFGGMAVLNKEGKVTAYTPEAPGVIGRDLSYRDHVKTVLGSGKAVVSGPVTAINGDKVVVIAAPIKDSSNNVVGVLTGRISLKNGKIFSTIIGRKNNDPNMVVRVISKDGIVIFHPDKTQIMKESIRDEIVQGLLKGKTGTGSIKSNGERLLAGYTTLEGLGWGISVEYPEKKALAPAIYLRDIMIGVAGAITLLVFLIMFYQSRAITRPLEELVTGVQEVGEGNFDINVDIKADNEIGVLARSFNAMVENIRDMRSDIIQKKDELEKANTELRIMAITDGLTKLYNHRYFQDCLEKAIDLGIQEKKPVTLIMLDIDHFKYYNDLFGHQAGDKLLEEMAQLLIRELGPNDMVARYGGEEFVVILYDSDGTHGLTVAEKIRRAVESYPFPGRHQQPEGKITISVGVATFPDNARNREDLVKLADEALYKAKCCSRNKVELYFSVLDDLKKDVEQSEADLINSIKTLIRIINAKDKYTYGHSERVGRYAVWIAEKLGLPEDEIRVIKMGAFLHDIGKIEVNRSILMKRGALTSEEFETIKKHPLWGAGIINAVDSLNSTLPIIKFHHERYDGTGYPKGLKGRQIPLHARILAVADSFDAMTSNRPYRKRQNAAEAIEELERCSGTQFDPVIVDVFLSVLQENKDKASKVI